MPYPTLKSACERLPQTADDSRREVEMTRLARLVSQRGQAVVEYILLIGLVAIFLFSALFFFRDSIAGFINGIGTFFQSESEPPVAAESVPPAPEPAPAPKATPAPPSSAPKPPEDQMSGLWCGPKNKAEFNRIGPGLVTFTRILPDGSRQGPFTVRLTPIDGNSFRANRLDGSFIQNYRFLGSNSFRLEGGPAAGQTFTRC